MMKRLALLPMLAASLVTLSACSGEEPGAALPAPADSSSNVPSTNSGSSSAAPEGGAAPTAELDPCSLLNVDDLAKFGTFPEGKPENLGGARSCGFDEELDSASEDPVGVTVAVRDSQGVDEVQDLGEGVQAGNVSGGREAVQTSGTGACIIALAVGQDSRVDIGAVAASSDEACQVADYVVGIVEPKLPEE
jgi:hypothetical protein